MCPSVNDEESPCYGLQITLQNTAGGLNFFRSGREMQMDNRVMYALTLAAIFISLINECDKENGRLVVRAQAESQLKLWEGEGGSLL